MFNVIVELFTARAPFYFAYVVNSSLAPAIVKFGTVRLQADDRPTVDILRVTVAEKNVDQGSINTLNPITYRTTRISYILAKAAGIILAGWASLMTTNDLILFSQKLTFCALWTLPQTTREFMLT